MATTYNPRIVTNGLVLCLDAGNTKSYPGSGTAWTDISRNGNNGTLTNGPTFSSANKGFFTFDGTNDYASINNTIGNFGTSDFTVGFIFKTTTSVTPATFIAKSIGDSPTVNYGWLVNQASSGDIGFAVATATGSWGISGSYSIKTNGGNINDGNWKYVNVVANRSQADVVIYINAISVALANYIGKASLTTLGNITNTQTTNIAGESDAGVTPFHVAASIPFVSIYNRALSATEVAQNFNALRGRYGV